MATTLTSHYVPKEGLDALLRYKYVSGEYSWLDLQLNPYWTKMAELLPRSMAPNLVTLIGTFHLISIAILAQIYDPQLQGKSPSWVYAFNAYCLWVYQTMDALDGKQARRTGSSSPLGQLFDHGCDGLGSTYISIGLCSLMGMEGSMYALAVLATVQVPFFLCQWEENFLHKLRAQVGNVGVTEGQYLSMSLNLVTAYFGVQFWKRSVGEFVADYGLEKIPLMGLETVDVRLISILIGGFFPFLLGASAVVNVVFQSGRNLARAALVTNPLILQQGLQYVIYKYPPASEFFRLYPIPIIVGLGLLHAHITNRMIVCSVCHVDYPVIHKILLPVPIIIMMIMSIGTKEHDITDKERSMVAWTMILYGIAIVIQFLHFVVNVINDITRHLGIFCFSITKRKA